MLPAVPACAGEIGLALSTSVMVSAPDVLGRRRPPSSVTEPVETPPITGARWCRVMVTVTTWLAVPSADTAVKLSVIDWPAPSCWIAVWLLLACRSSRRRRQREGAVAVAAGGAGLRREIGLALVDVGDGERRLTCSAVTDAAGLGHRAGGDAADHRGIVGAV